MRRALTSRNDEYKLELLEDIDNDEKTSIYTENGFIDLCRGPHLPSTGKIKYFKLLDVAGAYWRGDERNKMLTRIYGISFPQKSQLEDYLNWLKEAKKRNHKRLGKELNLFSFQEEAPGIPFWHPKGFIIYKEVINYWKYVHQKTGYQEINTPIVLNEKLWHQSGHWDNYKENMYFTKVDNSDFAKNQ